MPYHFLSKAESFEYHPANQNRVNGLLACPLRDGGSLSFHYAGKDQLLTSRCSKQGLPPITGWYTVVHKENCLSIMDLLRHIVPLWRNHE